MNQREWSESAGGAQASSEGNVGQGHLQEEKRAAERLADDAKAAASSAGAQAKEAAAHKAEELQGMAASHLRSFADAVRVAGDELAQKDPGPISDIVRQAAQGLEQFSGSLERKSPADMLDGFRNFGRQNPVGFLAGAMLAGFSLARFAGSSAPSGSGQTATDLRTSTYPSSRTGYDAAPDASGQRAFGDGDTMTGGAQSPGFEPSRTGGGAFGQPVHEGAADPAPNGRETVEVPS